MNRLRQIGSTVALVSAVGLLAACSSSGSATPASSSSSSSSSSSAAVSSTTSAAASSSAPASSASSAGSSASASITVPSSLPQSGSAAASDTAASSETAASSGTAASSASGPSSAASQPSGSGSADPTQKIKAAIDKGLLAAADLGAGFTAEPLPDAQAGDKTPCGGASTQSVYPNSIRSGVTIAKGNDAQLQESVSVYNDAATGTKAHAHDVAGISCKSGEIGGSKFTLSAAQDVTSEVGGTDAKIWQITIDEDSGVLIAIQDGAATINMTFLAAKGVDTSALPTPVDVAKFALQKIEKVSI
jgi:hypothetical protein